MCYGFNPHRGVPDAGTFNHWRIAIGSLKIIFLGYLQSPVRCHLASLPWRAEHCTHLTQGRIGGMFKGLPVSSFPPCGGRVGWGVTGDASHRPSIKDTLPDAEQRLRRQIRNRQLLGCKFRRQVPMGKYIVDFVCFENRLIVELDGGRHAHHRGYDQYRTEWLQSQGFKVIRVWNQDGLKIPPILAFPHKGGRNNVPSVSRVGKDQPGGRD